jgi:hypothetical protein
VLPVDFKANANLICAGFNNGKFLIWYIEANECEEDEAKDNEFGASMEDDEGSCLVKLHIKKVYEFQLFNGPISLITPIIATGKESSHVRCAIASTDHTEIILFDLIKDAEFVLAPASSFMVLEDDERPESISLVSEALYVWCRSGQLFTFSLYAVDVNYYREKIAVKLPQCVMAEYCPALSESAKTFVVLDGTKSMQMCSMEIAIKRAMGGGGADVRVQYQQFVSRVNRHGNKVKLLLMRYNELNNNVTY